VKLVPHCTGGRTAGVRTHRTGRWTAGMRTHGTGRRAGRMRRTATSRMWRTTAMVLLMPLGGRQGWQRQYNGRGNSNGT
jgi:hypothetical protein